MYDDSGTCAGLRRAGAHVATSYAPRKSTRYTHTREEVRAAVSTAVVLAKFGPRGETHSNSMRVTARNTPFSPSHSFLLSTFLSHTSV